MYHGFSTESVSHANAALLLYAMYRSRSASSPLNGIETWTRVSSFMRSACIKSDTTAKFVKEFCRKSKVDAIKPHYLNTGEPVILSDGTLVKMDGVNNYQLNIMADSETRKLYESEPQYIILLVRERIQREKAGLEGDCEDENND